jgi:hypothetical protein
MERNEWPPSSPRNILQSLCRDLKYSSTELSTAQHRSTQLITTQHSSTPFNTARHNSAQLNTALPNTSQFRPTFGSQATRTTTPARDTSDICPCGELTDLTTHVQTTDLSLTAQFSIDNRTEFLKPLASVNYRVICVTGF